MSIYDLSLEELEEYILKIDGKKYNAMQIFEWLYVHKVDDYSAMSNVKKDIPIFSIMFGDASSVQLEEIAKLTNAKVFDGRTNLLRAFKEVRGYN